MNSANRRLAWMYIRTAPILAAFWVSWVSRTLVQVQLELINQRIAREAATKTPQHERKENMGAQAAYRVALTNRYPGGRIHATETTIEAWDGEGNLRVSVAKDGTGHWTDQQRNTGALDPWSLDPIPKEARYMKLYPDGRVAPAEEYAQRFETAKRLAAANGGKVPSIAECKAKGWMDDNEKWIVPPQTVQAAPPITPPPTAAGKMGPPFFGLNQ